MEKNNFIKNLYQKIYRFIKTNIKVYWGLFFVFLSLLIIDFSTRIVIRDVKIASIKDFSPNLLTMSYILIMIGFILLLKGKMRKIIIVVLTTIFLFMFLLNNIYFNVFKSFFSFNVIAIAGEGTGYIKDVLLSINSSVVINTLIILVLICLAIKFCPKNNGKSDLIFAVIFIFIGLFCRNAGINKLGIAVDPLQWNSWDYKRNVYDSYTDSRKSLKVSGFYEYIFRDFYLSYFSKKALNKEENLNYLSQYFSDESEEVELKLSEVEQYSGIFKDKNLIVVMMESIDSWLLTEETMPTLNSMMNQGINFTNHFSIIYGGGATFNSEFMINTGYMTPFNGKLAAYSYSENFYNNSLANLFKNDGYTVNNFHYNSREFYNRGDMSTAFGYDNYISAFELGYGLLSTHDTIFMQEEKLKNLFLPDNKFMNYFTTYSAHMPYNYDDYLCKTLAEKYQVNQTIMNDEYMNCAKVKAYETDEFFRLLINSLKENNLYDNTIILAVADHYAYAYPDQKYIRDFKQSYDDNFLNQVPFFIWGSDLESTIVDKINSNLDVLPTIAYLFGLDYNPKYYLGSNILSDSYSEFIFFSDYSWYDGKTYFKDGKVLFGDPVDENVIINNGETINNILDINTKVLETNYFSNS